MGNPHHRDEMHQKKRSNQHKDQCSCLARARLTRDVYPFNQDYEPATSG